MLDKLICPERPLNWVLQFWPVPVFSFISALIATLLCKNIALKLGIVDKPDKLVKIHRDNIAYLGGVGILAGLTVGILTGIYCIGNRTSSGSFGPEHFRLSFIWLAAVLTGGSIVCIIGLIDDLFDIKPGQKILGQVAAAAVLIFVGIRPALYFSLAGDRIPENIEVILGIPIVIIFVLGASNSLNLLDGLDGLCAGFTVIIAGAMLLLAIHLGSWGFSEVGGDAVRVVIYLGLLSAVCGFLPFNRHPGQNLYGRRRRYDL